MFFSVYAFLTDITQILRQLFNTPYIYLSAETSLKKFCPQWIYKVRYFLKKNINKNNVQ